MTPAKVASILAADGQPVTLTYHAAGAYDPATGSVVNTDTTVATNGVVLPLSRGLKAMAGSTIAADAQQLLIPGDVAQPAIGTTATIGGKDYLITEVAPLAPAGTPLIYDCTIGGVP